MDWNWKTPFWGLTGSEQETSPNLSPICGSSSFGGQGIKGEFSVDLKLGHLVNAGHESEDNFPVPSVPKMGLSPPGSSKRLRPVNNGTQTATCLVDGCRADLSNCKEYHRRHKVCGMHSKTPEVTIGGHKQRFCQQCSRFHSLEEFDESKRSCRKRLDGHNRRRRKPQPERLSRSGCFLSNCQGSKLFPFSSPQVYPTTALANPIWAGVVKTKQDAMLYNQQLQACSLHDKQNPCPGSSSSSSYRGEGKQFGFLHGSALALSNQTVLPEAIAASDSGCEMFSNGLSTQGLNSNCALSLLSSSLMQTSEISLSHMVAPAPIPLAHPFGPSLHHKSLDSIDSDQIHNTTSDTSVHCQGMFHMGLDSPSQNEASQTLPFCWEQ